ncbi:MAG TPA: hypothetical protein VMV22_01585 [Acidimicrobiales bacterium]|nr:hypothetical protein [Acidimicrobiales bacterium]
MRKTVVGVAVTLVGLTVGACGSSSTATPTAHVGDLAGKTPAQVLSAAVAAARAQRTAHYVMTAHNGGQTQTISGDAGPSEGQQTVKQGTQQIKVVYVASVAYVQGNAGGLSSVMGLKAATANTFAGKWIAIHKTDGGLYSSIAQSVTLVSTLTQLEPSGNLTLTGLATVAGRQVIGVRGGLPGQAQSGVTGSATYFIATTHPTLPLRFSGQVKSGTQSALDDGSFSKWGVPLHLSAPTTTVPFSSIPTS